jgi:hypothetical protein
MWLTCRRNMVYCLFLQESSMFPSVTRHSVTCKKTADLTLNAVDNILRQMNLFTFITCLIIMQLITVRRKYKYFLHLFFSFFCSVPYQFSSTNVLSVSSFSVSKVRFMWLSILTTYIFQLFSNILNVLICYYIILYYIITMLMTQLVASPQWTKLDQSCLSSKL